MIEHGVYFAHGMESGPWGRKITALAEVAREHGFFVESPDYRFTRDPDERTRHLIALQPRAGGRLVLAGSSMGGYVAAMADAHLEADGLFLMAPALYMPGYAQEPATKSPRIDVVHGWRDDVIPVDHSIRFARARLADLHILDSDHGLGDRIATLRSLFAAFLVRVLDGGGG